jgi:hypothetical protein
MFVRLKRISGRRYAYLVEGKRRGNKVKQVIIGYLGPFYALIPGVPEYVRSKLTRKQIDWNDVNSQLKQIPVTLDELAEMKRGRLRVFFSARGTDIPVQTTPKTPSVLLAQRSAGELSALSKLSARAFQRMFGKTDEGYRMRE